MSLIESMIKGLRAIEFEALSIDDRLRLLDELRATTRRVQSPWDVAWEQAWVHGCTKAAIKALIDIGLFTKWAENGGIPMTIAEFGELTGADNTLLGRLLRQVAAEYLINEIDVGTYASTPWASRLGTEGSFASIYGRFYHDTVMPAFLSLPFFLREQEGGYQNPTNIIKSNWQRVHGDDSSFFGFVSSDPVLNQHFADAMDCHSNGNFTSWVDLYDTSKILSARLDRPLVVDIGGSKGHDIEKFLQKHPEVSKTDLVLQDLPEVLERFTIHSGVTACPYDFFTPQPVKGARIYYFHIVLHDWPDDSAAMILKNVRDAMEPGYSKILIHEVLVSDRAPSLTVTSLDLTMMALFSTFERSEEQFRRLIGSVDGLQIVKVWKARQAVESIIEVERT